MKRFYVGRKDQKQYVFKSDIVPTQETHGDRFNAVIGPFRTKRAAQLMALTEHNNPHIRCVADAERLAKQGI